MNIDGFIEYEVLVDIFRLDHALERMQQHPFDQRDDGRDDLHRCRVVVTARPWLEARIEVHDALCCQLRCDSPQ
jgi:hypothetical protein